MPGRVKVLFLKETTTDTCIIEESVPKEVKLIFSEFDESVIQVAKIEYPEVIIAVSNSFDESRLRIYRGLSSYKNPQGPQITVVSEGSTEDQRIAALESGVDEIIHLPISKRELSLRLLSKMRRIEKPGHIHNVLTCGNLRLYLERLEAYIDHEIVDLSLLEFNLLAFFVENKDTVLSRQKILSSVWKDSVVIIRTVDTHIASLRRKLKGSSYSLSTIYGAGYVLKLEKASKKIPQRNSHLVESPPNSLINT
jgi:DNA-binding response OmpR family regulator